MLTNGMCRPRLKLAESSTGSFRSSGHARAAIVRGERERAPPLPNNSTGMYLRTDSGSFTPSPLMKETSDWSRSIFAVDLWNARTELTAEG